MILGAKHENDNLFFLAKFADAEQTEEIPVLQANEYWPQSVIKFYEERLDWATTVHFGQQIPLTESIDIDVKAYPESVLCNFCFFDIMFHFYFAVRLYLYILFISLYFLFHSNATNANGKLLLWAQYPPDDPNDDGPCKFVAAKEANKKFPENNISFD